MGVPWTKSGVEGLKQLDTFNYELGFDVVVYYHDKFLASKREQSSKMVESW